jgi:hypothetical protein
MPICLNQPDIGLRMLGPDPGLPEDMTDVAQRDLKV